MWKSHVRCSSAQPRSDIQMQICCSRWIAQQQRPRLQRVQLRHASADQNDTHVCLLFEICHNESSVIFLVIICEKVDQTRVCKPKIITKSRVRPAARRREPVRSEPLHMYRSGIDLWRGCTTVEQPQGTTVNPAPSQGQILDSCATSTHNCQTRSTHKTELLLLCMSYLVLMTRGRAAKRHTLQATKASMARVQHCRMYGEGQSEFGNCPTPNLSTRIVSLIVTIARSHAF